MIDIAVIGAGPVGATLPALCADSGLSIALFEARPEPARDRRTLALSHASRELLDRVRAWPAASTAIESIHISQKGGPGRTLITAREQGLPALGHTLGYAQLQAALEARLASSSIALHRGERCEAIDLAPDAARVQFASGRSVE